MSPLDAIKTSFNRNAPAITFVVLVSLFSIFISTTYHLLTTRPQEFAHNPKVREYENTVGKVMEMDPWERVQYYWGNNLKAACISAAGSPFYYPLTTSIVTGYYAGIAITYVSHIYGGEVGLAFSAQIFVHGILELTGIYLIAAGGLRMAWLLWVLIGSLSKRRRSGPMIKRVKAASVDLLTLFLLGVAMIFIAAPLEAYVSPSAGGLFTAEPILSVLFLAGTVAFYSILVKPGMGRMARVAGETLRKLKTREFVPEHLSSFILIFFLALGIAVFL